MATIMIDGKPCDFEGRKTILQVAMENGVEIPHYCYHPGLSVVASCRICLAEVAAPNPRNDNKVELIPKLVPTCQNPAADGMEVHMTSPKAIANQKAVMEYLLINHPLDCPVCDQAGECSLQDYSYRYGRSESRFLEEKIKQPTKDIGPHVKLYADRCIMCSRCVRFCGEVTGTAEIGVFGRGNQEQIDVFPGRPLDNPLSGNVVDICPVGALLDKDFLFAQRVWFLSRTPSIDGITASGDNIWIHHNEGRIYRIKPRVNPEVNGWWISDEIRYGSDFVHSEVRLQTPRRMQYGQSITVDWKAACKHAVDGLRDAVAEHGAGSIALSVSPMLSCEEAYLLADFVRFVDSAAILAVGDIPSEGEDQIFPGGYTVHAEKCPNSRGVRRMLQRFCHGSDEVLDHVAMIEKAGDRKGAVQAVVLTGNYTSPRDDTLLIKALGKKFIVLLDTLAGPLSQRADVLLPGATWVEKTGTFENFGGRLQSFKSAIPAPGHARCEGQIALDLAAIFARTTAAVYDAVEVWGRIGEDFSQAVCHPDPVDEAQSDMAYSAL